MCQVAEPRYRTTNKELFEKKPTNFPVDLSIFYNKVPHTEHRRNIVL